MKPKKQFTPQSLRSLLSSLLVLFIVGGGALFYLGLGTVKEYAIKVDQRLADADASERQISELQTLKNQLSQSNSLIDKANQVFATPGSYQSQVLGDLKNYADAAGLSITNTTFGDKENTAAHTVTISFGNSVSYSRLITFLNNVEGNLPKLQVTSLSLGRSDSGNADTVKVENIKINISVR